MAKVEALVALSLKTAWAEKAETLTMVSRMNHFTPAECEFFSGIGGRTSNMVGWPTTRMRGVRRDVVVLVVFLFPVVCHSAFNFLSSSQTMTVAGIITSKIKPGTVLVNEIT